MCHLIILCTTRIILYPDSSATRKAQAEAGRTYLNPKTAAQPAKLKKGDLVGFVKYILALLLAKISPLLLPF